jgi:hypothetical protein
MEVLMHRFAVNCYLSASWLYIYDCAGILAFSVTPRPRIFVNLIRSFLLRQHSAKIKQIDSVEFGEVIRVHIASSVAKTEDIVVHLLSKLR